MKLCKKNHNYSEKYKQCPECLKISRTKWRKAHPEYTTVRAHFDMIFVRTKPTYFGMPFCSDWNPTEGGSFQTGAKWIIENLGSRPTPKHSLDIIEHHKGFIPGNLRWTLRQNSNQKHRTMFLLTLEQHAEALRQLGYGIYKLGEKNG